MEQKRRLQELDFLRGVAVILVLFRHHWIGVDALQRIGWIGVDLFFVLSGFLVSGLLFAEQKRFGNINGVRFLIRRGFKIYPTFYTSLLISFCISQFVSFKELQNLNIKGQAVVWLSELFFVQNYYAFIWGHHWSLAIEEHFYILLTLSFPFLFRYIRFVPLIFIACLLMRYFTAIHWPDTGSGQTHLRLDSLLMGVCIAYVYHRGRLEAVYHRYKPLLVALACVPLLFLFEPFESFFTRTIGFSLLYISFGSLLVLFLYADVKSFLWKPVSVIGFYSYGIYLFHLYLIRFVVGDTYLFPGDYALEGSTIISFLAFFLGSIGLGIGMSYLIEKPFLAIRERAFPRRV